jgi:hypothetical protein
MESGDIEDREAWTLVSRHWCSKAVGRLVEPPELGSQWATMRLL